MGDIPKIVSRRARERSNNNRRAFPRWPAQFQMRFGTGKEMKEAEPIEIGEGGLSFYSDEPLAKDLEINIEYRFTTAEPHAKGDGWVRLKGVVRHVQDGKIGVEFLNLRLSDRLKIVDFITVSK
jgi:hypothetical protein